MQFCLFTFFIYTGRWSALSFFQNQNKCVEFEIYLNQSWLYAQPGFTYSRPTMKTPEQCVKSVQS